MVKTKCDKNQIKISSFSEEKGIIRDVIAVLKEAEMGVKEALDSGYKILLKSLLTRITITFKSVQQIDEIFDTVLIYDSNQFLSTRFLTVAKVKEMHKIKLLILPLSHNILLLLRNQQEL